MKDYHFYCEFDEITEILKSFQEDNKVKFLPMGLYLKEELSEETTDIFTIPEFGNITHPDVVHAMTILAIPEDLDLIIREVPQRKGGVRFAIDMSANPVGITIGIGGYFGKEVLLPGRITTAKDSDFSKETLSYLGKEIRKKFKKKVGAYYISPKAIQAYNNGVRLVRNAKLPIEFDLEIE